MDFKKISENLSPYIAQAKNYGEKALQFTQKQAQNSAIFLKTEEEYNISQVAKRAIFIAYDESNPTSKEILLRSPVWTTKAWMDTAEIRFLSISANPDLARTLWVTGPIEMRISYTGKEYLRTNSLEDILAWWDNRCYHTDGDVHTASPIHDPLQQS
jgi:hypothetical protein